MSNLDDLRNKNNQLENNINPIARMNANDWVFQAVRGRKQCLLHLRIFRQCQHFFAGVIVSAFEMVNKREKIFHGPIARHSITIPTPVGVLKWQ